MCVHKHVVRATPFKYNFPLSHLLRGFVYLNHVIQNYIKIITRVFSFSAQSCLVFAAVVHAGHCSKSGMALAR